MCKLSEEQIKTITEILNKEIKFIDKQESNTYFNDDDNLYDMGLDSLGILDVIFFLEETFNISIDDDELKEIKTFGDIKNIICTHIKKEQ